jgi:hypothetical protein
MEQFRNHPLYRVHNIDSVMSSLWDFYRNKFIVLFITSFVMSLGLQLFSLTFDFSELYSMTDPVAMLEKIKGFMLPILGMSLVSLLFGTILQFYVINNPVDSNVTIFSSLYKSLKYFIPYLIIMILLAFFGSIAMMLGLLVLIIGVFFSLLYVMTIYMFVLPILIVEGNNIGNAISRTVTLAHRGFWSNMGWVAVFLLIIIVISVLGSAIITIPFAGSFMKVLSNPAEASSIISYMTNPVFLILSALVNAIYLPLMPIFAAIIYFNGRAREDGVQAAGQDSNEPPKVRVEDLYAKPLPEENKEGQ